MASVCVSTNVFKVQLTIYLVLVLGPLITTGIKGVKSPPTFPVFYPEDLRFYFLLGISLNDVRSDVSLIVIN